MEEPELSPERYVAVQHCILVREVKTDESWRIRGSTENGPYVLRGVSYRYQVDPDVEFPTAAKPPWAIYLRVTGGNAGPTRVLFRVHYRNPRGRWEYVKERVIDKTISFPVVGEETHDAVLNLPFLPLGGVGLHAITVHFWYDGVVLGGVDPTSNEPTGEVSEWATEPEEMFGTPDWAFGAADYFWIERPS